MLFKMFVHFCRHPMFCIPSTFGKRTTLMFTVRFLSLCSIILEFWPRQYYSFISFSNSNVPPEVFPEWIHIFLCSIPAWFVVLFEAVPVLHSLSRLSRSDTALTPVFAHKTGKGSEGLIISHVLRADRGSD